MATHADISGNLAMGAMQSVRRNAANTTFEAYTAESDIPYLVYAALLTQAGTVAPTAAVLQNTLGSVAWTRNGVGQYVGSLVDSSFPDSTFILTSAMRGVGVTGASFIYGGINTVGHSIDVVTAGISVGPPVSIAQYDGLLTNAPIEIRIYLSRLYGATSGGATVSGTLSG
jgi:hypothetical protein